MSRELHPLERLIRNHRRRFADRYANGTEPPLHPDYCGPCPDCRRALADYARGGVKRNIRYRKVERGDAA